MCCLSEFSQIVLVEIFHFLKYLVFFPILPESFLDFSFRILILSPMGSSLCSMFFKMGSSLHLLTSSVSEFPFGSFLVSVSLAKCLFCSVILFLISSNCLSGFFFFFLYFIEFLYESYFEFFIS